ncbi:MULTISPECIES: hypothetical protein [Streptomyces]|uniref:DNA-binding protein n=1 Tax=Streptomyces dengpaensis TaxID=2049881 RepID=A0ABN5I4F4_9ACTN|nr:MULTISPECIES: hypothetical protein [Streptomyces]AVH57875.1 hypothetical protein C4B68_21270 [Streptomyces dengpaensis]PIB03945.1 hypothetical protein B1C81_35455 [Streptomyces sp. HG99]
MESQITPPGCLTARDVQRALGITPGALRNLVYRGHFTRAGGTERHPWYAVKDVAAYAAKRAERQTA